MRRPIPTPMPARDHHSLGARSTRGLGVLLLGAGVVGLVGGCAVTGPAAPQGEAAVRQLIVDGRFEEALVEAQALADSSPDDAALLAVRRDAKVALLLERARRLSFGDEDEAALLQLQEAKALDPDSPLVEAWEERVIDKLASIHYLIGRESDAEGDYDAAVAAYQRTLQLRPEHHLANYQLNELQSNLGWRKDRSHGYYNDGVRTFRDEALAEARVAFEASRKYDDGDTARTERRITEVAREQALARLHEAKEQAAAGYWRSAHRAIQLALELDPHLPEIKALDEQYALEAEVSERLRDARLQRLRGNHDAARETLRGALDAPTSQAEAVREALVAIDDAEAEDQYADALALEHDFRYPESVAAYDVLLASRGFYKDAVRRREILVDTIAHAAELYGQAAAAKSDEDRVKLYRRIELVWPEYRDVRERLAALGVQR